MEIKQVLKVILQKLKDKNRKYQIIKIFQAKYLK